MYEKGKKFVSFELQNENPREFINFELQNHSLAQYNRLFISLWLKLPMKLFIPFYPLTIAYPNFAQLKYYLRLGIKVLVSGCLRQLKRFFELLFTLFVVFLCRRDHPQFQTPLHLALLVLHLFRKFEIFFHKDLHLILIFAQILRADSSNITHRQRLPTQIRHLNRKLQGVLEVVNAVFLVPQSIITKSQIYRR